MRYTATFLEPQFGLLQDHLFSASKVEEAAFAICRTARTADEIRLLVQRVVPVERTEIAAQTRTGMKIMPRAYIRAMQLADRIRGSVVFIHSHPTGLLRHSDQDDDQENKLFRTSFVRVHGSIIHGSLIMTAPDQIIGRVWLEDGSTHQVDLVRVIGDRANFYFSDQDPEIHPEFFDRQILAFGPQIQKLLARLRIGVVGNGGTGSAIAEQLIRLGVGVVVAVDGDTFDKSNINRVYGSSAGDHGVQKPQIVVRSAVQIGVGTVVEPVAKNITHKSAAEMLKSCDFVFGCTDDEWGRSILSRLAVWYAIPVFDMGVKIDSENGTVRSVEGRVTLLFPGTACLYCRGRITSDRVYAEVLRATDPARAEELEREGYLAGAAARAPAVISFTTEVAASAISEMLHKITGFKGADRTSTEVIHRIHATEVRKNRRNPTPGCWCADATKWCRGDVKQFLDLTWRSE